MTELVKNRKINSNYIENNAKNVNITENNAYLKTKTIKLCNAKKDEYNDKMRAMVKALFIVYPTLPNIVSIVDGIVEKRASSSISLSSIYSGSASTYKQIEKVIDMTERKCRLLNIFSLVKEFLSILSLKEYELIDMKFFRRKMISDIVERLQIEERSVYRKINKAIDSVICYCAINQITFDTINSLIKGEGWIREIYKKAYDEIQSNKARAVKNVKSGNV